MDNSKAHQQKKGSLIPLSLCNTLWSRDKSSKDSRSSDDGSSIKIDKDNGINVQVVLRCRPLSEDEKRAKMPVAISCNEHKREVSVIQNAANKHLDKSFVFDKVFGPKSQQKDLYEQAIAPIVNEALEGYNCTIFAYGETGTGKTYTMEGEGRKQKSGEFHNDVGMIPRAVQQIFDTLEAQNTEYSMKVTFLELYNEEITDLLVPDEVSKSLDDKSRKPIALMEDGKGAVFVRGLEERVVRTADEIYKILEEGSGMKHTECNIEGIELIKCGKLNLVDLAGAENILRSGAREERAREAGEINKSLLTLGRVINALVGHSVHVPYRDSKLTRLLRDSLGGKTKTCIIATISPSIHCLEETISTLDYAYRAKTIKNRPEVNQKVIKSELIKDLYTEIDRLKQELRATREKNGIYIPRDHYMNEEAAKKAMAQKLECMEIDSGFKNKQLMELQELYINQQQLVEELREKLEITQREFEQTGQAMLDLEERYSQSNEKIKEKDYLIFNLLGSEKAMTEKALELHAELGNAASEVSSLLADIDRKSKVEDRNRILIQNFRAQLDQQLEVLHETVAASVTEQQQQLKVIEEDTQLFVSTKATATEQLKAQLGGLKSMYGSSIKHLDDLAGELDGKSQLAFDNLSLEISNHSTSLMNLFKNIASEADPLINKLQNNLNNQEEMIAVFAQQQHEAHSRTLQMTQSISSTILNFFESLSLHFSKLTLLMEKARTVNDQELHALEKKLKEYAVNEERQLLDKVAKMLATSTARKIKLVQTEVDGFRGSAANRINNLHQEMSNIQDSTNSVQEEWETYMQKIDAKYIEDSTVVESVNDGLEEGLRHCMEKANLVAEHWRNAKDSLLSLRTRNVDSMNSIVKDGVEANQVVRAQFSSVALSTMEEAIATNKSFLSSIEDLLKLDQDASKKINSLIATCCEGVREMEITNSHKTIEIIQNAEKSLVNEYRVNDQPSPSAPQKQPFNLPRPTSIEELKTPPFEDLLKSFWATRSKNQQLNGDVNKSLGLSEAAQSFHSKFYVPGSN
ncbi:Kinesin-like protein KIN-5D [Camellia lanceoleosa]|uniref:Kinesin-like protein KIN-5D n=1 Tax=Camellia lanceoleosa TaxID=1840588 RepID=A0ACC0HKS9_9ERIC|nr:Kinesin-like protein KIN-5D [Camellia lanceoleosa]